MEKKPRLFIRGDCTDNTWWFCGGPSLAEAKNSVGNLLEAAIENLFDKATSDGTIEEIELKVSHMTDAEVDALPDI